MISVKLSYINSDNPLFFFYAVTTEVAYDFREIFLEAFKIKNKVSELEILKK